MFDSKQKGQDIQSFKQERFNSNISQSNLCELKKKQGQKVVHKNVS